MIASRLLAAFLAAACLLPQTAAAGIFEDLTVDDPNVYGFSNGRERFLVSSVGFRSRVAAVAFCESRYLGRERQQFKLANIAVLNLFITAGDSFAQRFVRLPEARIDDPMFSDGSTNIPRSGYIAFASGLDRNEESYLRQWNDSVVALLDGCGDGCRTISTLSQINARFTELSKPQEARTSLPAICSELASYHY